MIKIELRQSFVEALEPQFPQTRDFSFSKIYLQEMDVVTSRILGDVFHNLLLFL